MRNTNRHRHPDHQYIAAAGGPAKLARALSRETDFHVETRAVGQWSFRGVPLWARPYLAAILLRSGVFVPADFVRQPPPKRSSNDARHGNASEAA